MNLLANTTIPQRLAGGFALMVLLLIGVVVFSLSRLSTINTEISRITGERMQRIELIQVLLNDIGALAQAAESAVVATGEAGKQTLAPLAAKIKARAAQQAQDAGDGQDADSAKRLVNVRNGFEASLDRLNQFVAQGDSAQALDELLGNFAKTQRQFTDGLRAAREHELKRITETREDIARSYSFALKFMLAVSLGAIVLAVAAAVFITRSVTRPLKEVLNATEGLRAGEGDLTFRLPALKAEFGTLSESLNGFIRKLHDIIATVSGAAGSVNVAAREIAAGHTDLSSRTEQQAATLESTAADIEELAATVKHNASNARQARALAVEASAVTEKGGVVIGEVVQNMERISGTSRRVSDIVGVIDSIAFQTNILALNAAVEAARAGEQGRGFAVVAAEVRALAQRSATAAREIKSLIEESLSSVDAGSHAVAQAGETMTKVVSGIRKVSELIGQLSDASDEQSRGIERVSHSISSLEAGSQRNATMVQQAATATASLEDQARAMTQAVGVFKLESLPSGESISADALKHKSYTTELTLRRDALRPRI